MSSSEGYIVQVTCLSPNATEKDVRDFFSYSGEIDNIEILRWKGPCTAYVTFKDAYAMETAVLLSGSTIVDERVCIQRWGHYEDEGDLWDNPWNYTSWYMNNKSDSAEAIPVQPQSGTCEEAAAVPHADPQPSTTAEKVPVAPKESLAPTPPRSAADVVKTMLAMGYELSKDALSKAKAFDDNYKISAGVAGKVVDLGRKLGVNDHICAGIGAVKSVDQNLRVSKTTKQVLSVIGRTAVFVGSYLK